MGLLYLEKPGIFEPVYYLWVLKEGSHHLERRKVILLRMQKLFHVHILESIHKKKKKGRKKSRFPDSTEKLQK